jgi:glycosyltransferase involved in cell wall biosynthesis
MISVCLATYNGEKYIKEQLLSILKQLGKDDEIIISDDHSTDGTLGIIEALCDSRISVFFNSEKGYTSNFENALRHINGDIVFISDQDDIWDSNKVEICLEALQSTDLVVSDCQLINNQKEIIAPSYFELRKVKKTSWGNLVKFGYLGCCLAFRSELLKKALPFPTNRQLCTHDNWLFLVGAFLYRHKVLDERLIYYRRHDANVSTGGQLSGKSQWFKIKYRVYLCFFLLKRSLIY